MSGQPEPLDVFTIDPASDDLRLDVTPFELAYDLSQDVVVEADIEPFDPDAEAARAARVASVVPRVGWGRGRRWDFSEPLFRTLPSPERARWWREYLDEAERDFQARNTSRWSVPPITWPAWLYAALTPDPTAPPERLLQDVPDESIPAFRPLLREQSAQARAAALAQISGPLFKQMRYDGVERKFANVAKTAVLGGEAEVAQALAGLERGSLTAAYMPSMLPALLAPTVAERVEVATRTGAAGHTPEMVVAWVVATGSAGFGLLLRWLDDMPQDLAADLVTTLGRAITGPGGVALFVEAQATKGAAAASAWLRAHPAQVLGANLTAAQARRIAPLMRAYPTEYLQVAQTSSPQHVRAAAEAILAEAAIPELDPATLWWAQAATGVAPLGKPVVPRVLAPQSLPPLLIEDSRLGEAEVATLLGALSRDEDHPLVTEVRQRARPDSLDLFALTLVQTWLANGAPPKQLWMMTSAGRLGGDRFVQFLTPLVREWPGQSQHKRAVHGLTALRNVGSDTALQAIAGIAAKIKFQALKKRANEAMDEIAQARALTRGELEDRIVPDGGLDERGTRTFDYGPRQFQVNLTPEGKVAVRTLVDGRPTGKPKTVLPPVLKSDDAALAAASRAEFTVLKKAVTDLARVQTLRFEQAMLSGRRWTFADQQQFIARQPLLRGLLAALIWGVYADDGALTRTVRMDEDGLPVDADDSPVAISPHERLGIVHPIELDAADLARWGEVLADYELLAPFRQLDRAIFTLPADQGEELLLRGVPEASYPAGKLMGAFTKGGWVRGAALDAGVHVLHAMPFESAGVTAVIVYTGMSMGPMSEQEDQAIEAVYLLEGIVAAPQLGYGDVWSTAPNGRASRWVQVPWSGAPAAVVSEVMATVNAITG